MPVVVSSTRAMTAGLLLRRATAATVLLWSPCGAAIRRGERAGDAGPVSAGWCQEISRTSLAISARPKASNPSAVMTKAPSPPTTVSR
jgi:hypothetical protein